MDPHIWPGKSRTTSSNIHPAAMWGYGMWPWRSATGDERLGEMAREGQGMTWWWIHNWGIKGLIFFLLEPLRHKESLPLLDHGKHMGEWRVLADMYSLHWSISSIRVCWLHSSCWGVRPLRKKRVSWVWY